MLSAELKNISIWLADNKLSLHLGKMEAILFGSSYKVKNSDFNVPAGGSVLAAA